MLNTRCPMPTPLPSPRLLSNRHTQPQTLDARRPNLNTQPHNTHSQRSCRTLTPNVHTHTHIHATLKAHGQQSTHMLDSHTPSTHPRHPRSTLYVHNTQHTTVGGQHLMLSARHTAQRTTHSTQHAAHSAQRTAQHNTQRTAQHTTHSIQYTAHSTRHSTLDAQHPRPNSHTQYPPYVCSPPPLPACLQHTLSTTRTQYT